LCPSYWATARFAWKCGRLSAKLDYANSVTVSGTTVPGLKSRDADTGVEMMAGQTLAIAGLVQSRVDSLNSGLPWIGDVPYLGVPFRRVNYTANEVELLIMVTPELVEAMDADEVPPCGPGMQTTSPSDWELFMKGYLEVPAAVRRAATARHRTEWFLARREDSDAAAGRGERPIGPTGA